MNKVRVVLCGVGAVGRRIAKFLLEKEGVEIVGAIDIAEEKVGRDLGEVIGANKKLGVEVSDDADAVFSRAKADVMVHATTSFLKQVYPQITKALQHRVNVISTCEELSYPRIADANLAGKLDELAKRRGVTVLGTGVNPGFVMDTLPITLTGACQEVKAIKVDRSLDAANRRVPFQKKIGAGLTPEELKQKLERGEITAHVGLEQSMNLIASALGWELDEILVAPVEPVIAERPVASKVEGGVTVESGQVAGLKQSGWAVKNGKRVITLNLHMYMGAEEYELYTIEGVPTINMKNTPCMHGDISTVAMIVNSIPKVINASPGLATMKDLPIPSATPEHMGKYIKQ
ncbi:MAG: Gfo/Idh/MocA family oxidoreductase [Candidatus Bathyarchaeia archaeon]